MDSDGGKENLGRKTMAGWDYNCLLCAIVVAVNHTNCARWTSTRQGDWQRPHKDHWGQLVKIMIVNKNCNLEAPCVHTIPSRISCNLKTCINNIRTEVLLDRTKEGLSSSIAYITQWPTRCSRDATQPGLEGSNSHPLLLHPVTG